MGVQTNRNWLKMRKRTERVEYSSSGRLVCIVIIVRLLKCYCLFLTAIFALVTENSVTGGWFFSQISLKRKTDLIWSGVNIDCWSWLAKKSTGQWTLSTNINILNGISTITFFSSAGIISWKRSKCIVEMLRNFPTGLKITYGHFTIVSPIMDVNPKKQLLLTIASRSSKNVADKTRIGNSARNVIKIPGNVLGNK